MSSDGTASLKRGPAGKVPSATRPQQSGASGFEQGILDDGDRHFHASRVALSSSVVTLHARRRSLGASGVGLLSCFPGPGLKGEGRGRPISIKSKGIDP